MSHEKCETYQLSVYRCTNILYNIRIMFILFFIYYYTRLAINYISIIMYLENVVIILSDFNFFFDLTKMLHHP